MANELLTDDEIITAVLEGRSRDFEILITRYSGKIINFINSMYF
jgi:hypothetical protein